ncbi:MAG: hypothetical protein PHF25_05760 [Candidatus Margulisbacteria bacterium]|nr:hypothetical protein [Candidatus Margulisiibacteriota bacterium]
MKKSKVFMILLFVFLSAQCMAYSPAIIGGVRGDGTTLGLVFDSGVPSNDLTIRFGIEGNATDTPGIVFVGGKWFLRDVDNTRFPMFLNIGLVGFMGKTTTVGPYVSIIMERMINLPGLFLEFGIDLASSVKLQAQVGYFF